MFFHNRLKTSPPEFPYERDLRIILQSAARLRYNAVMSANAFAISRDLAAKGVETADAAAEAIVTYADDSHATKQDVAVLRGKIKAIEAKTDAKFNILFVLNAAIFITLVSDKFA